MRKKMITMKYTMAILFLTVGVLFVSCSGDDNSVDSNGADCLPSIAELPASLLGTYTGELETQQVSNTTGTATIVESVCKTYTINFSDNVPSITDIKFVSLNNTFVFGDPDREIGIEISAEGVLVAVKTSEPVLGFSNGKK